MTLQDYRVLADFRYQIRRFLRFSEQAAAAEGLEAQQHQFLLTIRAKPMQTRRRLDKLPIAC